MTNPLNLLLPAPPRIATSYRWGYVSSVSPTLNVLLDTETNPIINPSTLVPLEVGDRVFVLLESRRATVLGRTDGWTPDLSHLPVEVRRGSLAVPNVSANSGGGGGAVTFSPAFGSAANIYIRVMLPSARLTWAYENVSATGATLNIDNHSDNTSTAGTAYWIAERYA